MSYTDEQIYNAYMKHDKSSDKAGKSLGINGSTVRRRIQKMKEWGPIDFPISFPEISDGELPIEELIEKRLIPDTKRRIQANGEKNWFTVKVDTDKPIGIVCFGDPHVDDNYCDWETLKKHINIARSQENIFAINIGDAHNNWVGRLMRLYAEQEMSRGTAYRLVEWFMFGSNIKWLAWILGNHDSWNEGGDIQKRMGGNIIPMHDWRAKFKLVFKNKKEVLCDVAHDHKGHSQWNQTHAQAKVAMMEKPAHIIIAGHRHVPDYHVLFNAHHGIKSHLIRVGSYKAVDSHALVNGFAQHQWGQAFFIVIDPQRENGIYCFDDLEAGRSFLNSL